MVWPKMAGEVPSTGITRSRMFSTAPNFSGVACCSSERGRRSLTGFSTEKTVITSSGDTPSFFSFHLIFEARGSFTQSERVPILILVGSLLPPVVQGEERDGGRDRITGGGKAAGLTCSHRGEDSEPMLGTVGEKFPFGVHIIDAVEDIVRGASQETVCLFAPGES
jgi:hypothetical protein